MASEPARAWIQRWTASRSLLASSSEGEERGAVPGTDHPIVPHPFDGCRARGGTRRPGRAPQRRRRGQRKERPGRGRLARQQRSQVARDAPCLGDADRGQGAKPASARADPGAEVAQREDAGGDQLCRQRLLEPARYEVRGLRRLGGQAFQAAQQGELALAQALAAQGFALGRMGLGVEREHLRFPAAVQAVIGGKILEGRTRRARGTLDAQAHQAPGAFPAPARHRAYRVNGLLVRRLRFMAVLGAQVAPGAVGDRQAFGHGAQVREVVRAQAARTPVIHQACGSKRASECRRGHGGRPVGHDGLRVGQGI